MSLERGYVSKKKVIYSRTAAEGFKSDGVVFRYIVMLDTRKEALLIKLFIL